jgi:hypothetical protein
MQFGIYAPIPMATVGAPEAAQAAAEALGPLPPGRVDAQFEHSLALLQAADKVGFDLVLFAERHLGNDISAWLLASAIGSRLERIRALVAVHPGLWDPVMVGKLAASLDRMCKGRMALNIVNGWFDEEFRMFGGTVLQGEERYRRTIEFIDILRGLWANEKFSFDGQFYKLDNGQLLLKPATSSLPEIYSVSRSDRGRDFIAEQCDWWFVDIPKTAETIDDSARNRRCDCGYESPHSSHWSQGALCVQSLCGAWPKSGRGSCDDDQTDIRFRGGPRRTKGRETNASGHQGWHDRFGRCGAEAIAQVRKSWDRAGPLQDDFHRRQRAAHCRRGHHPDARQCFIAAIGAFSLTVFGPSRGQIANKRS